MLSPSGKNPDGHKSGYSHVNDVLKKGNAFLHPLSVFLTLVAGMPATYKYTILSNYFTISLFQHFAIYEHPLVSPQVVHFKQVPFLTMVKLPHDEHISPV